MGRRVVAAVILAACCKDVLGRDAFTTNAICKRNNCINPVFPGMEDLRRLEGASWQCSSLRQVVKHMSFCREVVTYDPALPNPTAVDGGSASIDAMVRRQDMAASTMFFYHMSGLGLEPWDYSKPEETDDDCVKSIWRMVCYTYFPRAKLGCQVGLPTTYVRPCQSSCHNYIRQCGVECCDESVQCVFEHTKAISSTKEITTFGYVPHDGPSSMCTGGARRMQAPSGLLLAALLAQALHWLGGEGSGASTRRAADGASARPQGWRRRFFWVAAPLSVVTFSLQGCDADVPTHSVGNWRAEPDYLLQYEFVPPGAPAEYATLNSCSVDRLSPTLQCNGRGVCRMWDVENLEDKGLAFCECSRYWADPECRTRRKSQVLAYLISIFLGPFGADQFYLGFWYSGVAKLATLGGFGLWWVYDIIRIGSAPVQTKTFRLAGDLPHWVFVLLTVNFALLIGFVIAWVTATQHVARRRKDILLMQAEEEARALGLKRGQEPKLRQAGADPGQPVPEVVIPGTQQQHLHHQQQQSAAAFYGTMNQLGQVPVSPGGSVSSLRSFGAPSENLRLAQAGPAKPGPWAMSMNSMPQSGQFQPSPPTTLPPPPPGQSAYGINTVYATPTTPAFPTGAGFDEAL